MSKDLSPSTFLKGKISRFGSPMNKRARNLSEPLPFLSNYALNDYCYNPPKFDLLKIKTDFFKMEVNFITHTPLKKRKTYLKKERSPFEISKSIAPEKLNALAKRIKTEEEKKEDKKRASIVEMEKNLLYFDTDKVKKNNKILNRRPIIADVYFQYYKNKNQNSLCNLKELSNLLNIHEYQKSMKKEKKKEEKDLELQKLIDEYGRKKKIWEKIDPNMEITEKDKKLMQNPKKLKLTFLILPKNVNKLFN